MEFLNDKIYLKPPDNEPKVAFECVYCGENIYEGDDYYALEPAKFECCEKCIEKFRCRAETPDYEAERADFEHDEI